MSTKKPNYKLVIVESPAKAKTIAKFLGSTYRVKASNGHVRDLPKSKFGIDVDNGFEPHYITIRGRGDVLETIRKEAKGAKKVILATDPDREGEAISWHLAQILGIDPGSLCRVEFNEITKKTVTAAVKKPRTINMELVDAQQARRILDRIVGYKISPLLWMKIKKGLSAGRVQSVTTRLVVDREEEIDAFVPEEYWSADTTMEIGTHLLTSKLISIDGEKVKITNADEADAVKKRIEQGDYHVTSIKRSERHRHPLPPFTTSNLQQEAGKKLGFSTAKTMQIAQQLYEGVEVEGQGSIGLISYIRTDSVRLSDEAVSAARSLIETRYGKEYVPEKTVVYKGKNSAQDAHEAIRPTNLELDPETVRKTVTRDQYNLYKLIYNRFVACQMADALYELQQIEMKSGNGLVFRTGAEQCKFAGFTAVYDSDKDASDDSVQSTKLISGINEGDKAVLSSVNMEQHFTQPPARYTEATLVRALEEAGIGRPSTYAPTISTVINRGYVLREKKQLYPSELGIMTTDLMKEYFEKIVDTEFTAGMEEQLDEVENGKRQWRDVVTDFYGPFMHTLEVAESKIEKIEIRDEESDVICDKCGARMVYKMGRYGRFLACPNFPECRNTKTIVVEIPTPCPKCGAKVLEKISRKGKRFYGCERYPECDFVAWNMPVEEKCPKCGSFMTLTENRRGRFHVCGNESCRYRIRLDDTENAGEKSQEENK
ncbi:MAG: type I DNA topoisomerase [Clostridia bacterium]|nr:type I DNA topoisomerase [Clostridia bacterium]